MRKGQTNENLPRVVLVGTDWKRRVRCDPRRTVVALSRREADGGYWLVTPAERGRVEVEDVPFLAVEVKFKGEGRDQELMFRTNLDEFVTMGPDNPLRIETAASGEPRPYILVRDGLEARLARPVFYELVDRGTEEQVGNAIGFGVWSKGIFFRLGEPGPDWD